MTVAKVREPKGERLEVRLTPTTKSLLTYAAQLRHTTLSDFLVSSAVKAAEEVIVSPKVFEISTERGWTALMDLLDDTKSPRANKRLTGLLSGQSSGK